VVQGGESPGGSGGGQERMRPNESTVPSRAHGVVPGGTAGLGGTQHIQEVTLMPSRAGAVPPKAPCTYSSKEEESLAFFGALWSKRQQRGGVCTS
jgi:hypothetical protein